MKKQPHELTHEELLALKELKQRRRVSTGDAPTLNAIYGRMTPGYTICETCVDTLAAEANSLILYAEKQIGGLLLDYTDDGSNDSQKAKKEKVAKTKAKKEPKAAKAKEAGPAKTTDGILETPGLKEAIDGPKQVKDMTNAEIVAYVLDKTGIELSEHAERDELIESAKDLLGDNIPGILKGRKQLEGSAGIVSLHANGLVSTKGEVIYQYVKQETGIELQQGLKRPALLQAAAEALGRDK